MAKIRALVLASGWLALSCSAPTIDTSSDESMQRTIAEVRASLPAESRAGFDSALQVIAFADMTLAGLTTEGRNPSMGLTVTRVKQRLEGKTADQVVAEAVVVRTEKETAELRELEERAAKAEAVTDQLAAFKINSISFRQETKETIMGKMRSTLITMDVANGTPSAISSVHFRGKVNSPGRSVPWIDDEFSETVAGGIEPGESATWKIRTGFMDQWDIEVPADAVITAEVIRLYGGADGKLLHQAEPFYESERLAELRAKYASQ